MTRIVFSVCTGSFLLATVGVLAEMKATKHFMGLESLNLLRQQANAEAEEGETEVVKKRWVGFEGRGRLAVITSGGISYGMDASLHIMEKVAGKEVAEGVARLMEYAWRKEA
jgi:transcriptional regulator GlxA family with amidase domain